MKKEDFFYFGRITKQLGATAKFHAVIDADNPQQYRELPAVLLLINNTHIPFSIENIEFSENQALITLDETPDPDIVELITGTEIYLPIELLPKLSGNKFYFHEIKGFTIIDKKHGELGKIKDVMEMPQQDLFQVFYHGKEVLIPVTDEVIQKVDRQEKQIIVKMPEGLIDIYR